MECMTHIDQNLTADAPSNLAPAQLLPHNYPLWVNLLSFLIIGLFLYSITHVPKLMKMASLADAARISYANGNYAVAKRNYLLILNEFPESRLANLGLIEAIFADKNFGDFRVSMRHLATIGRQLSKNQWKRVITIMPREFQKLFVLLLEDKKCISHYLEK